MQLQLVATSTTGLESVVAQELKDLGLTPRNSDFAVGRTFFEGDFSDLIKANLWLRCAGRVLVQLAEFDVSNDFDVIFDAVRAIEWENWAPRDANFHVEGRSVRSQITSVPALQRTVKKAIVDRLCGVWGLTALPETGPTYTVEISLLKNRATLTLDSTGRGLHRRGYRLMNVVAPLRETLAAALVKLSVWRPGRPLIDPFCASGTIPIEAALIARNIAPGLKRSFDAEGWPVVPRSLWNAAREEARDAILPTLKEKIHGYDIDEESLKFARQHAVNAGVDEDVVFKRRDFRDLTDDRAYGCVICNPPYGERLGDVARLRPLYESIPAVLSKLPTWSHYVVTSWLDFEKTIGQRATRRRKLYNSRLECVYYQFLGPKPPRDLDASAVSEPSPDVSTPSFENDAVRLEIKNTATPETSNAQKNDGIENDGNETEINNDALSDEISVRPESSIGAPAFAGLDAYADRVAEEFGRCLTNRARHLRRWPSRGITCYRLYDKDLPEVPLAIDIFEGRWLHIAEYDRRDERTVGQKRLWIDKMVAKAAEILNIEPQNVFFKRRARQRGAAQYEKLDETGRVVKVGEGGLVFLCNLTDYLDVGLFLDHRQTRQTARRESNGKRFLNLFCYSGAFTCYAADGGASSLVSVDLSPTYLDWCEANMEENGFYAPRRAVEARRAGFDVKRTVDSLYVKSDVLRFLRAIPPASDRNRDVVRLIEETAAEIGDARTVGGRGFGRSNGGALRRDDRAKYFKNKTKDGRAERGSLPERPFGLDRSDFELCVCDPPTFSNSKSTDADWDVQRRHVELLRLLATRMKPGGVVYFSNNYRRFKLDEESLTDLYKFQEITNRTIPEDFRNKRVHRCWRMIAK